MWDVRSSLFIRTLKSIYITLWPIIGFAAFLSACAPQIRNKANLERLLSAKLADTTPPTILQFDAPTVAVAGGTQLKIPILASDDSGVLAGYQLQYSEDGIAFQIVGEALPEATTVSWTVPLVDQTQVYLKLVATDLSNNKQEKTSGAFSIDSTPPLAPQITLTSSTFSNLSNATFSIADCNDTSFILISSSSSTPSQDDSTWQKCSTTPSSILYTLAQDGIYSLQAWAKDSAGNISRSPSSQVQLTYDGTAPTLLSVAVQTGLTVDVTFSETMGTGMTIPSNYSVSGSGKGTLATHPNSVSLVSGNKYRLTWTTGEMKNGGDITISVTTAQDLAGNTINFSSTQTAGGIGTPPAIPSGLALITPASSPGHLTSPVIRVSGVSSGDSIAIFSDSACTVLKASGTASSSTIDLTLASLPPASYSFYASATDAAGNSSACSSATVSYVLDTTPPTLAITVPTTGAYVNNAGKASVTVSGSCSENGRTISVSATDSGSTSVSGTPTCNTGSTPNWTTTLNFTTLADGTITLAASLSDAAGNSTNAASVSITKDVVAPTVAITTPAASSYVNNAGKASVTVSGSCSENGRTISVSATDSGSTSLSATPTCNTGSTPNWTTTLNFTTLADGTITLAASLADAAGNSTNATSVSITLDATPPTMSLTTLSGGQFIPGGQNYNITWTASDTGFGANPIKLEYSSNSGSTWSTIIVSTSNSGTYTWAVPSSTNSNTYRVRATASDLAGNSTSSASTSDFTVDSDLPTVSSFTITEGASSTTNNIRINLSASDPFTKVTRFCLKYNTSTTPTLSDSCWIDVNAPSPGISPATSITFSNYYFTIGFTTGSYSVYGWVRDQAGNISSLSSSGAGTAGTDKADITYTAGSPPTVINVLATSTDSPTSPPTSTDLSATTGNNVFVKWTASDDQALPATPVSLYYTTDDSNYTLIANNVANSANSGCTISGSLTGCYKWTSGSPSSGYFRIRVAVQDSSGMVTNGVSPGLNNMPPIQFLAGNTESGLNASATSALFFSDLSISSNADGGSLVVTPSGTVYFKDIKRGILYVSPTDGIQKILIPTTGTSSGDGGPISSATLKMPLKIALDYQNGLLVFDYNRIRRIDLSASPMTISTIIGGGASTADGVAPLSVQFTYPGTWASGNVFAMPLIPLPNGDIYFQSDSFANPTASGIRIRVYKASSNLVQSLYINGTGDYLYPSQDISKCNSYGLGMAFDLTTSNITSMIAQIEHTPGNVNCTGNRSAANLNPTTGTSSGPHAPNTNAGYLGAKFTGRDGKLYAVDRNQAYISRYDPTTNTWVNLVGNHISGYCNDGTAALSCSIDPLDAFVNDQGQVYFVDRGRIRTLDSSGNVITLMGQSFSYGDGGTALSARFNTINYIEQTTAGEIIAMDLGERRIRSFTSGGNIQTIAGNGSLAVPNTTALATAQGIDLFASVDNFKVNPTNGDVYFNRNSSYLTRLDRTTGKWTDIAGGGSNTWYNSSADGTTSINFESYGSWVMYRVLGFDGTNVLISKWSYPSAVPQNAMMKMYRVSDGLQTYLAGVTGTTAAGICSNGTAVSSCQLPVATGFVSIGTTYDSTGSRWLTMGYNSAAVRTITPGGTVDTLVTLPNNAYSFAYRRTGSTPAEIVYYCSASDGKLHKNDLTTDTTLAWPVSSIACSGKSLIYNSSTNSLIFIYTQNGMTGIAEYLNP